MSDDFDVRVLDASEYALVVTVDRDSHADVFGTIPPEDVAPLLRLVARLWEQTHGIEGEVDSQGVAERKAERLYTLMQSARRERDRARATAVALEQQLGYLRERFAEMDVDETDYWTKSVRAVARACADFLDGQPFFVRLPEEAQVQEQLERGRG